MTQFRISAIGLALGVFLMVPGVALAQGGGKGWLERLSGPGPFQGGFGSRYDFRLVCFYGEWEPSEGNKQLDISWLWLERDSARDQRNLNNPDYKDVGNSCWSDSAPNLKMYAMVEFDGLHSEQNNLLPADTNPDFAEVRLRSFKPALMIRLHPTLDVGVGFGYNSFSGDAFKSFSRISFQPIRVLWTPLAAFSPRNAHLRFLRIPFEANVFEGDFTSADFGNPRGSFSESTELLWSTGVVIDFWALIVGNKFGTW